MFQYNQPLNLPDSAFGQPDYVLSKFPQDFRINSSPLNQNGWHVTFDDEFDEGRVAYQIWRTSSTNRDREGRVYNYRDRFKAYFDHPNVYWKGADGSD